MKTQPSLRKRGFSLLETVIAIGVLAVLLTGFIIVFAPAAAGIKKSINVQAADRLASTLEQELVTLRGTEQTTSYKTGFGKAFEWIKDGAVSEEDAVLVYQYRGSLVETPRTDDKSPQPVPDISGKVAGKDYIVQSMLRQKSDPKFTEDLLAVEGGVYVVKCTQLVFEGGELKPGTAGQIVDPKNPDTEVANPDAYPEAVIAFSAEFYSLPSKSAGYFESRFAEIFPNLKNPVFSRNLAVRR